MTLFHIVPGTTRHHRPRGSTSSRNAAWREEFGAGWCYTFASPDPSRDDDVTRFRQLAARLTRRVESVSLAFAIAAILLAVLLWVSGWPALAVASPVLVFAGLEGLYRTVYRLGYGRHYRFVYTPYLFQDHPQYGNTLRPGIDIRKVEHLVFDKYAFARLPPPDSLDANIAARYDVNISRLGYRGPAFDATRTRPLRIFCSGGSTTACYGDDAQTWPARLAEALAARDVHAQVINGGTWGWTSTEELKRLSAEMDTIDPDVVLLHQGWNEEFLYAALGLGKYWKPGTVRSLAERELCVAPGSMLARLPFVCTYLFGHALRKRYFARHMAFTNRDRWRALLSDRYIDAWMNNLDGFCRLSIRRRFLLFTIDPPCLVGMDDERRHRELYIRQSRLTPLYADYQAVSKQRISHALDAAAAVVPCAKAGEFFASKKGESRLPLFRDEIHLTPAGDAMLGDYIASRLLADGEFRARYADGRGDSNVDPVALASDEWRHRAVELNGQVSRFVASATADLRHRASGDLDVPEDRYTTF